MNIKNLFFHIHYCNGKQDSGSRKVRNKFTRILQHHELIFVAAGKSSITIGKRRYQSKAGMLFYICPNVPHAIDIDMGVPEIFGLYISVLPM